MFKPDLVHFEQNPKCHSLEYGLPGQANLGLCPGWTLTNTMTTARELNVLERQSFHVCKTGLQFPHLTCVGLGMAKFGLNDMMLLKLLCSGCVKV